jgi:hypothetical protein
MWAIGSGQISPKRGRTGAVNYLRAACGGQKPGVTAAMVRALR